MELKLFYHYTAAVNRRNFRMPAIRETWTNLLPSLALKSSYVMDALLSLTSLHVYTHNSDERIYREASYGYMARAIRQHSEELNNGLHAGNAEPLYITSLLIAAHTFVARQFVDDADDEHSLPIDSFRAFQGLKVIEGMGKQAAADSKLIQWFPGWKIQPFIQGNDETLTFNFLMDGIENETTDPETLFAYQVAIGCMNGMYHHAKRRFFLRFLAEVPRRFVQLIERRDPRCLVILGLFFYMMKYGSDIWFQQGTPDRELRAITALLHPDWRAKLDMATNLVKMKMEEEPPWQLAFELLNEPPD